MKVFGSKYTNNLQRFCFKAVSFSLAFVLASCSLLPSNNNTIKIVYERAAQYHKPDRNPIIVIPGIMGSKLIDQDSNRTIWGAFGGFSIDPTTPDGTRLFSRPLASHQASSGFDKNVKPNGVLDQLQINLLGIPVSIQAYAGILATLGAGGYRDQSLGLNAMSYGDDHFTCFQFDYDWRLDNVANAKRLKAFIDEKRAYIQQQYTKRYGVSETEIKFDVVAHSMGGLLTRYFLRYGNADLPENSNDATITWAGTKDIDRAILIGTPNSGAVEAFSQLIEGYDIGQPLLPYFHSPLLGTFESLYQLLPRPRHRIITWEKNGQKGEPEIVDFYNPALWQKYGWGLASDNPTTLSFLQTVLPDVKSDTERQKIAVATQARLLNNAKKFHQALDKPALAPPETELFLVAGDAVDTDSHIRVNKTDGKIKFTAKAPGDGTVPRFSALMDERLGGKWHPTLKTPIHWSSVLFLEGGHLNITRSDAFKNNVLYWLLEAPRKTNSSSYAAVKNDRVLD